MTAAEGPITPGRFRLAPVLDGRAAWDQATDLVMTPVRLTTAVVLTPDAGLVLVTD